MFNILSILLFIRELTFSDRSIVCLHKVNRCIYILVLYYIYNKYLSQLYKIFWMIFLVPRIWQVCIGIRLTDDLTSNEKII